MIMILCLLAIFLTYGQGVCYKKVFDFHCYKEGCKASFRGTNMKLCHSELKFQMRGHSYQVFVDGRYRYQLSHTRLNCGFPVSLSWKITNFSPLYKFSATLKSLNGVRSPHWCHGKPHLVWGRVTLWASNLGSSGHYLPTARPTKAPTNLPTPVPTGPPTHAPTARPTSLPSGSPTHLPTRPPTPVPTKFPTVDPTITPTMSPTESPSKLPTPVPTVLPTTLPSESPSRIPSGAPSTVPTESPSAVPTASPTLVPTDSPTPAPTAWPTTVVPTQSPSADNLGLCLNIIEWTEIAQENCIALYTGWKRAKLCPIQLMHGFNKPVDEYESSLTRSMADHIFESCSTKCVYDIENTGVAYRWRTGNCWELVKDEDCTIVRKGLTWTFNHITDVVCHVNIPPDYPIESPTPKPTPASIIITTDDPTEAPTVKPTSVPTLNPTSVSTLIPTSSEASCMPRSCIPQQEWSEDLMDAYCSPDATGATYKHHCHIGRAAEPCWWYKMLAENLKKSLAMRLFSDCSSTCVYDYYTNAHSAWKWSADDLCWELQAWGPCHWDPKSRRTHREWESAKQRMSLMCPRSG